MNHFEYEQNIDDLGVTVIENAFLNHYMPNARGDYVKVYLFGLKVCAGQNQFPSNLQIAQALRLTESDVINAWKYWDAQGIICFTQSGSDCSIEYQKISSKLFINGNGDPKANEKKTKKTAYSAKIKQMNRDIEEKICRPLIHREIEAFLDWIETYGFTPQTVVLIVSRLHRPRQTGCELLAKHGTGFSQCRG
jgi:DNA replication protein DnaD